MSLPVERWCSAIPERVSRRKYLNRQIKPAIMAELEQTCGQFRPFAGVRSVIVQDHVDDVFSGIIGSYGKITGAPAYVAFIGDPTVDSIEAKVGYTGEGIILEATALGLATCWVAGFFKPAEVARQIDLTEQERVYAISPLGYTEEYMGIGERITRRFSRADQRRPAAELCVDWVSDDWPDWARAGVEVARVAPSAVNRQPWRFRLQGNSVIVSVDGPDTYQISKHLDCGIAMLHFELGAREKGALGVWNFLEPPDVAGYHLQLKQTSSS